MQESSVLTRDLNEPRIVAGLVLQAEISRSICCSMVQLCIDSVRSSANPALILQMPSVLWCLSPSARHLNVTKLTTLIMKYAPTMTKISSH